MSDIESIEQTLAYQLGRQSAINEVMAALHNRSGTHTDKVKASECHLISFDILKPMWLDSVHEASRLYEAQGKGST